MLCLRGETGEDGRRGFEIQLLGLSEDNSARLAYAPRSLKEKRQWLLSCHVLVYLLPDK